MESRSQYSLYICHLTILTGIKDLIADDKEIDSEGCMLTPIILGSDKTTVSVATGQNEYYPLYISIGNVRNNVRRAHRGAVVVLAFLAIPKGMPYCISVIEHLYSSVCQLNVRTVKVLSFERFGVRYFIQACP